MKPIVGVPVQYHRRHVSDGQIAAAIITGSYDDGAADLVVFTAGAVEHVRHAPAGALPGCWSPLPRERA